MRKENRKACFLHLEENQISYRDHFGKALRFASVCAAASFKALVHGIIPCWFKNTSNEVFEYINEF